MFTGIITNTGKIKSNSDKKLQVSTNLAKNLQIGESVAVDGVCLTVTETDRTFFAADYIDETARKTTIARLGKDQLVNLELPATPASFLSGHIVQGHVDCTAEVVTIDKNEYEFKVAPAFSKYIADKCSITVNGVSLTVIKIVKNNFRVGIIPKTNQTTSFKNLKIGDPANIEVDLVAKYLERLSGKCTTRKSR